MPSIIKRDMDRYAYQVYVTDALQAIAENTATLDAVITKGEIAGNAMTRRWADFDKPVKEETRTPEQVIEYMKQRCMEVSR